MSHYLCEFLRLLRLSQTTKHFARMQKCTDSVLFPAKLFVPGKNHTKTATLARFCIYGPPVPTVQIRQSGLNLACKSRPKVYPYMRNFIWTDLLYCSCRFLLRNDWTFCFSSFLCVTLIHRIIKCTKLWISLFSRKNPLATKWKGKEKEKYNKLN